MKNIAFFKLLIIFLFSLYGVFFWDSVLNIYAVGDVAGDMLAANRIHDEGYLLLGHWSVWQFNHPGPFWFYYNILIENLLSFLPLSRLQIWFIGSLFMNAILITFSVRTLSLYYLSKINIFYAFIFIFFLCHFSESIGELWMPFRIIAPYLSFFVSLLPLSRGNFNYFLPAILFSCMLIHGYAIMPFFTLPFIVIACCMGYRIEKNLKQYFWIFLFSFGIALIFISPLIIDYYLNQPYSNLNRLFLANQRMQMAEKPALSNVAFEVFYRLINKINSGIKSPDYTIFYLCPLLVFFILLAPKEKRGQLSKNDFLFNDFLNKSAVVFLFSALIYSLTIIYFSQRTAAPFIFYAVHFLTVIPPIIFLTILTPFFYFSFSSSPKKIYLKPLQYLLILILSIILFFSKKDPDEDVSFFERQTKNFVAALQKENPTQQPIHLGIDLNQGMQFATDTVHLVLGILELLNEKHISVCVTNTSDVSGIALTQKHRCAPNIVADFVIVPAKTCHYYSHCILNGSYFSLIKR